MFLWTLAVGLICILYIFRLRKDFKILAFFAPKLRTADGSPVENLVPALPGKTIFGNTFDTAGLDFGKLQLCLLLSNKKKRTNIHTRYVRKVLGEMA